MKTSIIARYLILLIAAALTILGIASLTRLGDNPNMAGWYAFYSLAMLIQAAVLLFCYFCLTTKNKTLYWLTFIILLLNIVLTIFDQVGWVDVLFMLVNLAALIALHLSRKDFLPE
jgi:hypothetical protein